MIIREERKKKGLTQAQLGRLIGLKESRVSKIEHGAPITPEVGENGGYPPTKNGDIRSLLCA